MAEGNDPLQPKPAFDTRRAIYGWALAAVSLYALVATIYWTANAVSYQDLRNFSETRRSVNGFFQEATAVDCARLPAFIEAADVRGWTVVAVDDGAAPVPPQLSAEEVADIYRIDGHALFGLRAFFLYFDEEGCVLRRTQTIQDPAPEAT